jgi:cytoskeletal protein CcmA (bactofilin family)
MLDNFRRKDAQAAPRPYSPFNEMQEALSPGAADPAKPPVKPEAPKFEPPKSVQDKAPPRSGEGSASKLIVGPDIKLRGAEITDCDTLVVEGRVEAAMDSRVIQIAEHGVFVGKVGIDVAEIRGRFEGELTARKQLVIRATGHVSGTIRYGKVTIEEGGELSGDVGTIDAKGPVAIPAAIAPDATERKPAAGSAPAPMPTAAHPGAGALFGRPAGPR